MLYLIFTQRITVGQFFSLFIYSFFIFGPLQELGNVINVYRETEVSLQNFEDILKLPRAAAPGAPGRRGWTRTLCVSTRVASSTSRPRRPPCATSRFAVQPRRDHRLCRTFRRGEDDAGETAGRPVSARSRGHIYYNGVPEDEIAIDDLRERIGFVTQDAQLFSGSIRENLRFVRPDASDEECLEVLRQAAVQDCWGAPNTVWTP